MAVKSTNSEMSTMHATLPIKRHTLNVSPTLSSHRMVSIDVQREEGSPYSDPFQNQISRNALYFKTGKAHSSLALQCFTIRKLLKQEKAKLSTTILRQQGYIHRDWSVAFVAVFIILIMVPDTNFNKQFFKKSVENTLSLGHPNIFLNISIKRFFY